MGWLWEYFFFWVIRRTSISIPLWDDCEIHPTQKPIRLYEISIPLWDDCENYGAGNTYRSAKFQFHYGMIVRTMGQAILTDQQNFNSTMGWLWDFELWLQLNKVSYFNSTMGWLWGSRILDLISLSGISIPLWDDCEGIVFQKNNRIRTFQFHYGMIVRSTCQRFLCSKKDFNSTMGWLWGKSENR